MCWPGLVDATWSGLGAAVLSVSSHTRGAHKGSPGTVWTGTVGTARALNTAEGSKEGAHGSGKHGL